MENCQPQQTYRELVCHYINTQNGIDCWHTVHHLIYVLKLHALCAHIHNGVTLLIVLFVVEFYTGMYSFIFKSQAFYCLSSFSFAVWIHILHKIDIQSQPDDQSH